MNSTGTGGAGTSNYVYIQSEEHAWIPARLDRLIEEGSAVTESTPTKSFFKRGKSSASSKKNSGPSAEVTFVSKWDDEDTIASGSKGMAGGSLTTQIISLSEYTNQTLPLQNVDGETGELIEVEDMVNLSYLHEPAILYNLKSRHQGGKPYTRTGDIVIAVNPYQWMMDLYSEDTRRLYASKLVFGSHNDSSMEGHDIRSTVAPHVYETSSLAYRGLAYDQQDQSVLVSGESGAGKTETVKILMNHLASVQNAADLFDIDKSIATNAGFKNKSDIVQRVLDSNPLLEAFGNAKTIRNDNSSRFGKYLQLQFDAEDPTKAAYAGRSMPRCVLAGSKCEVYLLEKSRVVSHNVDNERAYHIYYQLLAAPTEDKEVIWKDGLLGEDGDEERQNEDYTYVGYTDTYMIEGKSDGERYELTKRALGLIGVEGDVFLNLMRSICIVLQLGNIVLIDDPDDDERSVIENDEELQLLSNLMGISSETITKALTERTVRARNEHFMVPLKADKAMDSRDALAKEIYAKTFLWLVRKINDATCAEWNYDSRDSSSQKNKKQQKFGLIGLLDIFGFESFDVNRFEQLCINYANEKLQQKFTQDIFRSVQAEYEFEGIPLGQISYQDNADVLKLVEGRMGLIAILNEECVRPKGADLSFVRKVVSMCSNKNSSSTKTIGSTTTTNDSALWMEKRFQGCQFGIKHYAAKVLYDAEGFVQKNMDNLPPDLLECAKLSTNPIVAHELENDAMMNTTKSKSKSSSAKAPSKLSRGSASSSKSTRLVQSTVWSKFRTQLNSLMSLLGETRTRYIRCIKPNPYKLPYQMDQVSTMEQLRCAGVVAAVTISRSAFPNRLEHHAVLERFLLLKQTRKQHFVSNNTATTMTKKGGNVEDQVYQLLNSVLKSLEAISPHTNKLEQAFVIGRTRTYFRAGALEYLEGERLKGLLNQAISIQKFVRKHLAMVKFRILCNATIYVQTHIRRHLVAQQYRKMKVAIITIQSCVRMLFAKRTLMILRWYYGATQLQKLYRGMAARIIFTEKRLSVIIIQAMIRGALQRPKYQRDLAEKKEEAKMENQLLALQRRLEEAEQRRIEAEKRAEEEKELLRKQKEEQEKIAALQPKEKIVYRDRPSHDDDDDDDDDTMHTADDDNDSMHTAEAEEDEDEDEHKVEKQQQKKSKKKKSSSSRRQKQQQQQDIIPTATAVAADDTTHGDTLTTTTNNKPGGNAAIVNNIHHHHLTEQQQRLMDESGKMLEHLRKEVFKLRNQNAQLRTDFDLLKDNNQRLMDANANAGASFGALNQHAKQLNKRNTKLTSEVHHLKSLLQKQNMVHVELKEELKMKQNTYITEVQSRLTCEKAISTIVDMITTRCRDQRLVEDILQISDDTEEILNMAREGGGTATGGAAAEPRNNGGGNDTPRSTGGMMSRFTSIFY